MATKRRSRTKPKEKVKPQSTLQNLAARPTTDDPEDEQLVDASGVFRVTTQIARAQINHDEDEPPRFASDSLVMAAQQGTLRDPEEAEEPPAIDDEAVQADKRQRLETLAALARNRSRRS